MTEVDRSDPGTRAAARFDAARARERTRGFAVSGLLTAVAVAGPFAAEPLTGDPGATVGAVVGSLLLLAVAVAVWPHEWQKAEEEHRRLEAIWRELRPDADTHAPWERYGAWAEPRSGKVELSVLTWSPLNEGFAGAPSPYSQRVAQRIDADDVAVAAEAMERLRADVADRELKARERYHEERSEADRQAHEELLRAMDEEAAANARAADERARRELSDQEAAEREAQAQAVARALRRP